MKKTGLPNRDELVICKITRLFPNSASCEMIEYGKPGMIHVSEVASRWVRDIREFLKDNQMVICRVMRVDGDQISLSIKRVRKEEGQSKLNAYNREKKAEKWLELAAKQMKKSLDQAYSEAGNRMVEEFGGLMKAFDVAAKNPELLKQKGIPQNWAQIISEIAAKSIADKTFTFKANLELSLTRSDGIEVIRAVLLAASKDGIEVKYISAPRYLLTATGKNPKELEAKLHGAAEEIEQGIKAAKGEFSVEYVKT